MRIVVQVQVDRQCVSSSCERKREGREAWLQVGRLASLPSEWYERVLRGHVGL